MKGILLLAHGSRESQTKETMDKVTAEVKKQLEIDLIECAYLQFCSLSLDEGLDALKSKGADEILVIPYFLFEGVHIKEDIPGEIEKYKEANPNITIKFGSTLGSDKRLAMIVADRVREIL